MSRNDTVDICVEILRETERAIQVMGKIVDGYMSFVSERTNTEQGKE